MRGKAWRLARPIREAGGDPAEAAGLPLRRNRTSAHWQGEMRAKAAENHAVPGFLLGGPEGLCYFAQ